MDITKIYSDPWDGERYYSVLMDEDELALFSEYQKEFGVFGSIKGAVSGAIKGAKRGVAKANVREYRAIREANLATERANANIIKRATKTGQVQSPLKKLKEVPTYKNHNTRKINEQVWNHNNNIDVLGQHVNGGRVTDTTKFNRVAESFAR